MDKRRNSSLEDETDVEGDAEGNEKRARIKTIMESPTFQRIEPVWYKNLTEGLSKALEIVVQDTCTWDDIRGMMDSLYIKLFADRFKHSNSVHFRINFLQSYELKIRR
jgi:hypothetical protein